LRVFGHSLTAELFSFTAGDQPIGHIAKRALNGLLVKKKCGLLLGFHETRKSTATNQAPRNCSPRKFFAAPMVSEMKIAITTSCVIKNGGSDCVGASAFRAGTFMKSCAIKTKTFRYSATRNAIT
jgi:hypothetical protein